MRRVETLKRRKNEIDCCMSVDSDNQYLMGLYDGISYSLGEMKDEEIEEYLCGDRYDIY